MRLAVRAIVVGLLVLCVVPLAAAQATVTFTGRLTDSLTGQPLANAHVRIELAGAVTTVVTTGADGTYTAGGLAPGTYLLYASAEYYVAEYFDDVQCAHSCIPVSINVPPGVFTADFALEPFATVRGTIVDAATGHPAAGVRPTVRLLGTFAYDAQAEADGTYVLHWVSPDSYTMTISGAGYITERYAGIPCVAADCTTTKAGTPIHLTAGQTATIDISLSSGGRIAGTVRRATEGTAISGLIVEVFNAATSAIASTTSGLDGSYAFSGLPVGSYYVRTQNVSFPLQSVVPRVYGGDECPLSTGCRIASGQLVSVTSGATTTVDFGLRATGSIGGSVTASGAAAASVRVEAYTGDVVAGSAFTTAGGTYQIAGLAPGSYRLRTNTTLYADEWRGGQYVAAGAPSAAATVTVAAGALTAGVDFDLAPGGAIAGTIAHDLPFLGYGGISLQVAAYNAAGEQVRVVSFDGALDSTSPRTYTIDGLAPGTYFVRALNTATTGSSPWFFWGGVLVEEIYGRGPCVTVDCDVTRGTPVAVTAGAVTGGVNFSLKRGGRLTGAVGGAQLYDARGVPLDARRFQAAIVWIGQPAMIVGLPPGTYYLRLPDGRLYNNLVCPDCAATSGTPILVSGPDVIPLTLPPVGTAAVSGFVRRDTTGDPLSTITVVLTTGTGAIVNTALTDLFGGYAIPDLSPGTYYLRTSNDRGFVDELYGGIVCADCPIVLGTPVTVAAGAQVTGIDFALAEGTPLSGRVTDTSGVAIASAGVGLFDTAGELRVRVTTDATGQYAATVPPGTFYARLDPTSGYAMQVYKDLPCADAACEPTAGTPITAPVPNPPPIDFHAARCTGVILSPSLLAMGAVGDPYRQRFTASGGLAPHRFLLAQGLLPPGLTLGAADGVLAGTPTAGGTYGIGVAAVDAAGCPDVHEYTVQVAACSFVLSPASIMAPAAGGRFGVTLIDACGDRTVRSSASWVQPDPTATGPGFGLTITANAGAAPRSVTLTVGRRTLLVQQAGLASTPPFGALDIPADGAVVEGSMALGGWALDDLDVRRVAIFRDPVTGETGLVYLGDATFVPGVRPDVAAAYPALPGRDRAGWGFLVLTNMLPNQGNGVFRLHAVAEDVEGYQTLLGTRSITASNAGATIPFGTIDTPAQGATISGSAYINFGWVLTPQPKTIPLDGSTISVLIDGKVVGHPSYNFYRSDVSTSFPGLANSAGPVGFFTIDTTTLADGLHTIAWVVTDDGGASAGIGSRYFVVDNSTPAGLSLASNASPVAINAGIIAHYGVASRAVGAPAAPPLAPATTNRLLQRGTAGWRRFSVDRAVTSDSPSCAGPAAREMARSSPWCQICNPAQSPVPRQPGWHAQCVSRAGWMSSSRLLEGP